MEAIRVWINRAFLLAVGFSGLVVVAIGFANLFASTTNGYGLYSTPTRSPDPSAGIFGAVIVAMLAVLPSMIAGSKGLDRVGWWMYGVWVFPIALVHALVVKPTVEAQDADAEAEGRVRCKFCAEYIRPEAVVCRWCGNDVAASRTPVAQ